MPAYYKKTNRRVIGLTEFHFDDKAGLGSTYSPMATCQRIPRCKRNNLPHTFWFKRNNDISLIAVDGVCSSSHTLTIPASLALFWFVINQNHLTLAGKMLMKEVHCQEASHHEVTLIALSLGYC